MTNVEAYVWHIAVYLYGHQMHYEKYIISLIREMVFSGHKENASHKTGSIYQKHF